MEWSMKDSMILCIDGRLLQSGGIGTFLRHLILACYDTFELFVLCQRKDKSWFEKYPRIKLIEMNASIYSFGEQIEFVQKIPHCDLFFAPHFNVPLLPIRAKKRLTCIHDLYHLVHKIPFLQKIYAMLFYHAAFFLSDCITTVSHFSKSEIMRFAKIKPKKMMVIYNAVISQSLQYKRPLAEEYLLVVGNVKPHKNLRRLIAAYTTLNCSEKLVIVGKRKGFITEEIALETLSEKVMFTDYVEEEMLYAWYAHAKLFIFPSLYEGFGLPPIEAMSMGCPVLASDCGSIPEICKDAAYYIDALSEESLIAGMRHCLHDHALRENLIVKGKKVADSYSFEKFKETYHQLIYSTLT